METEAGGPKGRWKAGDFLGKQIGYIVYWSFYPEPISLKAGRDWWDMMGHVSVHVKEPPSRNPNLYPTTSFWKPPKKTTSDVRVGAFWVDRTLPNCEDVVGREGKGQSEGVGRCSAPLFNRGVRGLTHIGNGVGSGLERWSEWLSQVGGAQAVELWH